MKCLKCGYTSFDYLRECKKCGENFDDSRKALNLKMGEPTLFAGLKDEPQGAKKSELEKPEETVDSTPTIPVSPFSETDFSPSVSKPLPVSPVSKEQPSEILSEDISSGLGTLGSMDGMQPRPNKENTMGNLPKIELDSPADTKAIDGLELAPSFNTDSDGGDLPSGEKNKEAELVLFADKDKDKDKDKPETDNQLKNDIPFDFSDGDLERDISLSVPSETTDRSKTIDKELTELELDMEDEESLDQILADLKKDSNTKD